MSKLTYIETPNGVAYSKQKDRRGFHRIRWQCPETGKPKDARRKVFDEAREEAHRIDQELAARRAGQPRVTATVDALISHYLEPRNRAKVWSVSHDANMTNYCQNWISPRIGALPCREWAATDSTAILADARNAGLAPSTVAMLRRVMKALALHGTRHGFLTHDPLVGVRVPDPGLAVDPLMLPTRADIERLAEKASQVGPEWRGLQARISAYTGLRAAELHGLHAGDVDLERGCIRVVRQARYETGEGMVVKPPKHRSARSRPRETPIPGWLDEELAAHIAGLGGEILFPSPEGGYQNHAAFSRLVYYPAARAAGWHDPDGNLRWKWHDLRHFFCTWALSKDGLNADPTDVAQWAGHSSAAFTYQVYVGPTPGSIERARARTKGA